MSNYPVELRVKAEPEPLNRYTSNALFMLFALPLLALEVKLGLFEALPKRNQLVFFVVVILQVVLLYLCFRWLVRQWRLRDADYHVVRYYPDRLEYNSRVIPYADIAAITVKRKYTTLTMHEGSSSQGYILAKGLAPTAQIEAIRSHIAATPAPAAASAPVTDSGAWPPLPFHVRRFQAAGDFRIVNPDGTRGQLLAVWGKRQLLLNYWRSHVNDDFYGNEAIGQRFFSMLSRPWHFAREIFDAEGNLIGSYRKSYFRSLFRSRWIVKTPQLTAYGREISAQTAFTRRLRAVSPSLIRDLWPLAPYNFEFLRVDTDQPVMTCERTSQGFVVDVPDPQLDFRVAAATVSGLSVLQYRGAHIDEKAQLVRN